MRVAFGINSNGLGHATRCYPLITACLAKGHEVHVISSGRALTFLEHEFKDKVIFHKINDYTLSKDLFEKSWSLTSLFTFFPKILYQVHTEHKKFLRLHKKYKFDRVISDTRFGIFCDVPSYIIYHFVRTPVFPKGESISEAVFLLVTLPFKKILIPDTKNSDLAGDYTKNFRFMKQYEYLGILSMMKKKKIKQDIDYYFSISGPEPQRTHFEKKVRELVPKLKGNVVVTFGKPERTWKQKLQNVLMHSYTNKDEQQDLFNRSKLIITRSGYTTILDLAEIDGKALFIPTKDQPEQEYLAQMHDVAKRAKQVKLEELTPEVIEEASSYKGFDIKEKTKKSVEKFLEITGLDANVQE